MCLSTYLAFVIGSYLFITSLAMLANQNRFKKVMTEFLANQPLLTLSGAMGIIFGLLIVAAHNVWVADWVLLITLIGWFTLLQGIVRMFFPSHFIKMAKELHTKVGYWLITWIWLLIGIYLIWAGFQS